MFNINVLFHSWRVIVNDCEIKQPKVTVFSSGPQAATAAFQSQRPSMSSKSTLKKGTAAYSGLGLQDVAE